MKRDMDIVRCIVLAVRNSDQPVTSVPEVDGRMFAHHAQLLNEAGLIQATLAPGNGKSVATQAVIHRLTWDGHDFADAILDDTIWRKAKDNVLKPAGAWTFGILLEYLKFEIRTRIPGLLPSAG